MINRWECMCRNLCPYEYDSCTDPTQFCPVLEDTPKDFEEKLSSKRKNKK
jgi:hypothetical protein